MLLTINRPVMMCEKGILDEPTLLTVNPIPTGLTGKLGRVLADA